MANDASEWTLCIIKPDAVSGKHQAQILQRIIDEKFEITALRLEQLSRPAVEGFYAVHRERPFFKSLTTFMTSGPCMPMILEKAGAVAALRTAIGATDPAEAAAGSVRKLFAESKERNAIHASDSDENALREAGFFFAESEVLRAL
jgi:nucleoside-diphosphate kinase